MAFSSFRAHIFVIAGGLFCLALTACGAPATDETDVQATVEVLLTEAAPAATSAPTAAPLPSETEAAALSFEPETYSDPSAGFEFDYPAGWTVGPVQQYSRGGITAFTSWARPTDVFPDEAPPGETRMDATVQLWDPTGDLEAFVGQRRGAWDASGIAVVSEETLTLEDGRPAMTFVVQGTDGAQAFFFLTTIGDKYLVLSGSGDLALLAEIARTVRPLEITY
jgi:hypothetical protein